MKVLGIDISSHNSQLDFCTLKKVAKFCMIRAGSGYSGDTACAFYVKQCEAHNIPYGFYWASYATDADSAHDEAQLFCTTALQYSPSYPLAYDYEGFTVSYQNRHGFYYDKTEHTYLVKTALNYIESRKCYAMLYANYDFFMNRFNLSDLEAYDKWLAHWDISSPSLPCGIWQYRVSPVDGSPYDIDQNIAYKDYPKIITKNKLNGRNL